MQITTAMLRRFAGSRAKADIIQAIADAAPTVLPKYGITTARRLQHFFAQIAHESGGFTIREENLSYTAKRMTEVWPRRFPTIAAAQPYAKNPRALANKTYGGRMGNRPGTDDGYDYRGRGLIQITGRDGYAQVGRIAGIDLVGHPDRANDVGHLLEVAASFWKWKGLNPHADHDDELKITKLINGGTNGLADRRSWLAKARRVFVEDVDAEPATKPVPLLSDPVEPDAAPEPDDTAPHAAPEGDRKTGITEGAKAAGGLGIMGVVYQVWEAITSAPEAILDAAVAAAQRPTFWIFLGIVAAGGYVWYRRASMKKAG
jgi:putative chitinase